jgi:anti-sigma factor RsiW
MDCTQCAENLTAFLDGELRASASAQIRLHLDTCPSCANELRGLKESADFIESHHKELEPRLESWNLVRARLSVADSSSWFHFFSPNRWRIAMVSLAIVAALGVAYLQYQQFQRRNLEEYIAHYMQDREARGPAQSFELNAEANYQIEMPYADNPFSETRAAPEENPFSPEEE